MKRSVLFLVVLLVLLSVGAVIHAQDAAPTAINIGATIPLTGRYAGGGAQVQRGYQIAVDDINKAGGVQVGDTKLPFNLTILDDESDPAKTVTNLETLNSQGDVTLLGGFGSDLHVAAAPIAEKDQVPYIGVAFALWDIHQQGYKYLFSPFPKSPDLVTASYGLINSIAEDQRPKNIAIVQEKTDWGIEMAGMWQDQAAANNINIAVVEQYAPGTKDFTDIITDLQAKNIDAVLGLPTPPDGIALVTQMAQLGYTPKFMMLIRAPDAPTWVTSVGTPGDDVMFAPGWSHTMKFPGVDQLNQEHQALYGRPADPVVGPAYASIQILAAAITKAGKLDRDAIRDALAASDTQTVIGEIKFRDDGTGIVTTPILQYQQGKVQVVWPADFATAPLVYPAPALDQRTPLPTAAPPAPTTEATAEATPEATP